ncbi:hypothetical protein EDD16DRAFT_925140 [Pisolithus croceorrhizus]|nr:hypothetical protein EDD16DRAFT_925140 [Pisolithus croceorrhizus]
MRPPSLKSAHCRCLGCILWWAAQLLATSVLNRHLNNVYDFALLALCTYLIAWQSALVSCLRAYNLYCDHSVSF